MRPGTRREAIAGPAGRIECAVDAPEAGAPQGIALVAHPHPLYGGTLENKVVQTLARAFNELGYVSLRPNFRGVGASEGRYDEGCGELEDLAAVLDWGRAAHPGGELVLAGFSFGAFVQSHLAARLAAAGTPAARVVFVGTAAGRFTVAPVPADSIVIHGEVDDTVPLAAVLDWARPQELPLTVLPGADHFFHGRLHLLRSIVRAQWHRR
ncbi:MAG: alpha/beta fold hydrolase [Betaproteobacteria bacterium]|nr:alpha/beta fold hydrolase [Betaproteobacteria bacterium]